MDFQKLVYMLFACAISSGCSGNRYGGVAVRMSGANGFLIWQDLNEKLLLSRFRDGKWEEATTLSSKPKSSIIRRSGLFSYHHGFDFDVLGRVSFLYAIDKTVNGNSEPNLQFLRFE